MLGNSQYSRRECLKITGAPDSINNDDLEENTLKIFDNMDVTIDPSNTEDCHWLKSNGTKNVIIKFARCKDANLIRKKTKTSWMKWVFARLVSIIQFLQMIASVYITGCYGKNAKNFGLLIIFMLFGCPKAHCAHVYVYM